MGIVYANIGSNLGNKKELIETALKLINREFGILCLSRFVESEPWGYDSSNLFLNIGVAFKALKKPEEILTILQKIEKAISDKSHRDKTGRYCDREIDIDIVAIDDDTYTSARLNIPHKHLKSRQFFLEPLKELCPDWKYPVSGESIDELLFKLKK